MVLNVHRNREALLGTGRREQGGTEVGGRGRFYTYRYPVTTRMTSALRWAAMRDILMLHNCEGQSHKTVSTDHNFWRERRAEADSNRGPSAYQPNALPLGQTGSQVYKFSSVLLYVHRNRRFIRDGSPWRSPQLSHSSWTRIQDLLLLKSWFTSAETVGWLGTGTKDGHLDFHTASELCYKFFIL